MSEAQPYAITISRQLGSGGGQLGRNLAARLGIAYVDREIVHQAAQLLDVSDETVESLDERLTPFWESMLWSYQYASPGTGYIAIPEPRPTGAQFSGAETLVIRRIAGRYSAVIVGRGGFHALREHPRHLSVFVHAPCEFRTQRIRELYGVSEADARKMMSESDGNRRRYLRSIADADWGDARQYHICLDTGVLGFDGAEEAVIAALRARLGGDDIR